MNAVDHSGGGKRRRTSPSGGGGGGGGGGAGIDSLTDDILVAVADYLPKTSRALFAVALTAPSSSWRESGWKGEPGPASKAIISSVKSPAPFSTFKESIESWTGSQHKRKQLMKQIGEYYGGQWDILDFVDVRLSLASKITDDDVGAVLACIDAKHKLKRLNLTHCFGIVGHGLAPLRNSVVLEKIDMGLALQSERLSDIYDDSIGGEALSQEAVFPIVLDIIGGQGNAFRRLQVPKTWCVLGEIERGTGHDTPTSKFVEFTEVHSGWRVARSNCCYFGIGYGLPFDDANRAFLSWMRTSEDPVDTCISCSELKYFAVCVHCEEVKCARCEGMLWCYRCPNKVVHCRGRCSGTSDNPVQECTSCRMGFCGECRVADCRDGTNDCDGCKGIAFDRLIEQSNEQHSTICDQQTRISSMQDEIEELRQTEKELRVQKDSKERLG